MAMPLGACLSSHPTQACPTSPYVSIWDWLFTIPVGDSVTIEADEYSGTYITDWYWWWSGSGVSVLSSQDWTGSYPTSSRTLSFSAPGEFTIWAEAQNSYGLTDSDYARVSFPLYTAVSSGVSLTCGTSGGGGTGITWKSRLLPSGGWTTSLCNPSTNALTTTFTPNMYGTHEVKAEYTVGGYPTGQL